MCETPKKGDWGEKKKKLLNDTSLSRSQRRGNYSSSDYETVDIIEIRVKRIESGGKGEGAGNLFSMDSG